VLTACSHVVLYCDSYRDTSVRSGCRGDLQVVAVPKPGPCLSANYYNTNSIYPISNCFNYAKPRRFITDYGNMKKHRTFTILKQR